MDEVDSILIDEARTPLIISGAAEDSSARYIEVNKLIPSFSRALEANEGQEAIAGDFTIDEKQKSVELTEAGHEKAESLLAEAGMLTEGESLYAPANLILFHHLMAGLRAHHLFQKNIEYIIQGNQVVIVDEHTGRTMPGRRWSDGLHQAIEAKEGLDVQKKTKLSHRQLFRIIFGCTLSCQA